MSCNSKRKTKFGSNNNLSNQVVLDCWRQFTYEIG